ncbi:MAG TPA: M48 family metallopeptidase [Clostridia bacterium]|nr:M48 family metallopeptidase [Clostridia bacterium]
MKDKVYYIESNGIRIAYILVKTRRKTIGITVDKNGEVKVAAPLWISEKKIQEIVEKKTEWIVKKVKEVRERNSNRVGREFVNGEKFFYLGKEYALKVEEKNLAQTEVIMGDDTITVHISQGLLEESRKQLVKETLLQWYRQRFAKIAGERIKKYSRQIKVSPCKVVIRNQKTRWGSCSSKGNINLNWRLVMAPLEIIDYVIVHELCHLKIMNHSKDFWNLVESILPSYAESKKWLKVNESRLR